jgi:hypothetical protein
MMTEGKLMDVKLVKEDGGYYLNLTYQHEDDKAVYETNIPRVYLPINTYGFDYAEFDFGIHSTKERVIDIGFGELKIIPDKKDSFLVIEVVETKTKEMTIEEIEKILGHKVKIVGEKEIEKACSNCRHLNQLTGGCRLSCKDLEKFEARED